MKLADTFRRQQAVKQEHADGSTWLAETGTRALSASPIDGAELREMQDQLAEQFGQAVALQVRAGESLGEAVAAVWAEGVLLGARHIIGFLADEGQHP